MSKNTKKRGAKKKAKKLGTIKKAAGKTAKTKTTKPTSHRPRCAWQSDGGSFCIRAQGHKGKHEDLSGHRW